MFVQLCSICTCIFDKSIVDIVCCKISEKYCVPFTVVLLHTYTNICMCNILYAYAPVAQW